MWYPFYGWFFTNWIHYPYERREYHISVFSDILTNFLKSSNTWNTKRCRYSHTSMIFAAQSFEQLPRPRSLTGNGAPVYWKNHWLWLVPANLAVLNVTKLHLCRKLHHSKHEEVPTRPWRCRFLQSYLWLTSNALNRRVSFYGFWWWVWNWVEFSII